MYLDLARSAVRRLRRTHGRHHPAGSTHPGFVRITQYTKIAAAIISSPKI